MCILRQIELGRRNADHAKLLNQPEGKLEVARLVRNLLRELDLLWNLHLLQIHQQKVPPVGNSVRQAQFVKDCREDSIFVDILFSGLLVVAVGSCQLQCLRSGLLHHVRCAEANTSVRQRAVLHGLLVANDPANTPTSGREALTCGPNRQGSSADFWAQKRNSGEVPVLAPVDAPVVTGHGPGSKICRWMQLDVLDLSSRHLDVGDVLVEEGLKDDDLVARSNETEETGKHALVGPGGDQDFVLCQLPSVDG
ncbi:hypothetical protein OGATHE_000791 [Ogataea polymorpha]|uniref:Uncharacterized protein n=1 Tax=Ogataea polymorpha TaxID=460523 RepID=A0A9P8PSG7_9ASCO|nr:hypothetical protein OGATHE_000791 [Ogataea polymorpha]